MPPRYRVLEPIFLQPHRSAVPRKCKAGEIIEYAGEPGIALEALDVDGRRAKAAALRAKPFWRRHTKGWHTRTLHLARSLGAPAGISLAACETFIENWLATAAEPELER